MSGASWSKVVKLSILLQRTQKLELLRNLLAQGPKLNVPEIEISLVDGFAGEKYLLEIEATALSAIRAMVHVSVKVLRANKNR